MTIAYKVFGNDLSGTFSQLDTRHANFNGGSVFMYIAGHKPDPVTLEIEPPAGWRIINGRMTSSEQRVWQFPNYDLLIDTPTEIAPDWTVDEFKVDSKTIRVVVHSFGEEGGKRELSPAAHQRCGAALELDVAEGSENDHGPGVHRLRRRASLL